MGNASRRAFLASAPAAALLIRAAPAASSTMQMLGVEMERLWEAERHADAFGTEAERDAAYEATSDIVTRIHGTPARSLADFRVKARALSWCYGGGEAELFEPNHTTTDVVLVKSIIRDLLAA